MRINLPVTDDEYDYPAQSMLVSSTDTKGVITHCNAAFIDAFSAPARQAPMHIIQGIGFTLCQYPATA